MSVHPLAVVAEGAELHPSVEVGPYCTIGPRVVLGEGTRLISHAVIDGDTVVGKHNTVFPFASLGMAPQDLKYHGEQSQLRIGDHNVFREGCTVHRGTEGGGMLTSIADHCLLMAYSHVAHDSHLGNHVIMANVASLAGHVTVQDYAILGGLSGVHQFCTVGESAFLAGGAKATQDVPPFCIIQGDRARVVGPNMVGLRRRGWTQSELMTFRDFFRFFFMSVAPLEDRLRMARERWGPTMDAVKYLLAFVENSERGVCPYGRPQDDE